MKARLDEKKEVIIFTFETISEVIKVWKNQLLQNHTEYDTNWTKFLAEVKIEFKAECWSDPIIPDYGGEVKLSIPNILNADDIYEILQRFKFYLMPFEIILTTNIQS